MVTFCKGSECPRTHTREFPGPASATLEAVGVAESCLPTLGDQRIVQTGQNAIKNQAISLRNPDAGCCVVDLGDERSAAAIGEIVRGGLGVLSEAGAPLLQITRLSFGASYSR